MRKTCVFVVTTFVTIFAIIAAVAGAAALDGKTFAVTVTRDDGHNEGPDQLVFAAGTFDSTMCRQYGFAKAPYMAKLAGDGSISFTATATSSKEGTNDWSGTVQGDRVTGTFKWTKEGKVINYKFEGRLSS